MRRLALALLGALLLLAGCYTSAIKLRHPDGRTATCGDSYAVGFHHFAAAERDRDCVGDYQRQGFERVPN
jgi:hypothetical protein